MELMYNLLANFLYGFMTVGFVVLTTGLMFWLLLLGPKRKMSMPGFSGDFMHELPLLINSAIALVLAFVGGVIAGRVGLPTLVGYMLAGIAIGLFTPGFVGDVNTVSQLAELGVIFLM